MLKIHLYPYFPTVCKKRAVVITEFIGEGLFHFKLCFGFYLSTETLRCFPPPVLHPYVFFA